jgi:SAM-dependent methyltransferase
MMRQMVGSDTSSSYYDELASEYQETSKRRLPYLLGVEKIVADVLLSSSPLRRLLDIGTGDGVRLARILKEIGAAEVVAIEQSSGMHHLAQKNIPGVTILNQDFVEADIPKGYFTHVTALWNVIGHVKSRPIFIEAVYKSLSKGGVFIFDVNNRYNVRAYGVRNVAKNYGLDLIRGDASGRYSLQCGGVTTEVFIYSERLLRTDLMRAGFKIKDIIYVNYDTGIRENVPIFGQILCVAVKE